MHLRKTRIEKTVSLEIVTQISHTVFKPSMPRFNWLLTTRTAVRSTPALNKKYKTIKSDSTKCVSEIYYQSGFFFMGPKFYY